MLTPIDMKTTRPYVMRARADAVAQTRRRIVRAALDLSEERMTTEITLDAVGARAGVSVQTVLRHFGSRDGLSDAVADAASAEVQEERSTPPGDVDAAIRTIFDHYERRGDFVLRMLAQEFTDERIRRMLAPGKRLHREWVETVFGPQLTAHPVETRDALVDVLVVATDVYTWKLLRRDRGLPRGAAEARVRLLITALV